MATAPEKALVLAVTKFMLYGEDKLDSSRFILVTVSEMSDMIPVAAPHPIFLDVGTKEAMERTGGPLAPLWFCSFRLHTVWNQPPGGKPVHQVAFPHL